MTMSHEDIQGAWMLAVVVMLYFARNKSPLLRTIWDIFALVMMIILIICTAGLTIKWVKGLFK